MTESAPRAATRWTRSRSGPSTAATLARALDLTTVAVRQHLLGLEESGLTALADGAASGSVPDETLMRREYYQIRGLDDRGFPTAELLKKTGLEYMQKRLDSL